MDGIHDLGGMEGFGPIPVKTGDHDFCDFQDWEKRLYALHNCRPARGITIDWFRHAIERMPPGDYLTFPYFNKWCTNWLVLMIDDGVISLDEVKAGHVDMPNSQAAPITVEQALRINARSDTSFMAASETAPMFKVGERARTRRAMPSGHHRLPRYARDASGTVMAHHGSHLLPDEGAKGRHVGEHLYTVSFSASDLWGDDANPRDTVNLDLWESYLVRA